MLTEAAAAQKAEEERLAAEAEAKRKAEEQKAEKQTTEEELESDRKRIQEQAITEMRKRIGRTYEFLKDQHPRLAQQDFITELNTDAEAETSEQTSDSNNYYEALRNGRLVEEIDKSNQRLAEAAAEKTARYYEALRSGRLAEYQARIAESESKWRIQNQGYAKSAIERGRKIFERCSVCHQIGKNARNALGPQLNGLLGRRAGDEPGYRYSEAIYAGLEM